jgi:hypothetical protein
MNGCVTRIGTGDITSTIAAVADALTFGMNELMNFISVKGTSLTTVTRMRLTGSLALRLLKDIPTVAAEGKSTVTVSEVPLNPFKVWA